MMEIVKTGMTRRMDPLGRLVIPSEIRHNYGLSTGALIEFLATSEGVLLRPAVASCCVCGEAGKPLREVEGLSICQHCAERLAVSLAERLEGR